MSQAVERSEYERVSGRTAWKEYGDLVSARLVAGTGSRFDDPQNKTEATAEFTAPERLTAELLSLDHEFSLGKRLEEVLGRIPLVPRMVAELHYCNGITITKLRNVQPDLDIEGEIRKAERLAKVLLEGKDGKDNSVNQGKNNGR